MPISFSGSDLPTFNQAHDNSEDGFRPLLVLSPSSSPTTSPSSPDSANVLSAFSVDEAEPGDPCPHRSFSSYFPPTSPPPLPPYRFRWSAARWLGSSTTNAAANTASPIVNNAKIAWRITSKWIQGPESPRPWRIVPMAEKIQTLPLKVRDYYLPTQRRKVVALLICYAVWLLTFFLVLRWSAFTTDIPGYGPPVNIGCSARLWSKNNACGMNGDRCRPFNHDTFAFRCQASCLKTHILEPYPVGNIMVNYQPLVIGGPPLENDNTKILQVNQSIYRGDSFICAAAIHAGFLTESHGGCGVLQLVGQHSVYHASKQNGVESTAFNSYFPQSFTFVPGTAATCRDLRWPLLAVSVFFSAGLSLLTTSPALFFSSIFTALFIHVALVSDPPGFADYYSLLSTAIGRFLPAAFCMALMYQLAIRHTLGHGLKAQIEKTMLWLGSCWVGALNNYTFDRIPIQRLTPHDLKQQPGAVPALFIIVTVIISIVLSQAWFLRVEGLMPKYLAFYGIFCGTLLVCIILPGLSLRIHHYILALLFLPGTRLQMRPSLVYQGLLVGFFINGIARWGFDSLLQTSFELRNDAPFGTHVPMIWPPIVHQANADFGIPANITFEWTLPQVSDDNEKRKSRNSAVSHEQDYDGISVLVNDVERFKAYRDENITQFTWRRKFEGVPEYFRFGYLIGGETGDYTMAGTWDTNLRWIDMLSGSTKK